MSICSIKLKISEKTAKKLENEVKDKKTKREHSGCFYATRLNNSTITTLVLNDDVKVNGNKEEVDPANCMFSFHTHPRVSYEYYGDTIGWPSSNDYQTYIYTIGKYGSAVHFVITLEGIYCICLSEYWMKNYKKLNPEKMDSFFEEKFSKDKEKISLKQYIKYINGVKYKKNKLINLSFKTWNQIYKNNLFICRYLTKGICKDLQYDSYNYKNADTKEVMKYSYKENRYYTYNKFIWQDTELSAYIYNSLRVFYKNQPHLNTQKIMKNIKTYGKFSNLDYAILGFTFTTIKDELMWMLHTYVSDIKEIDKFISSAIELLNNLLGRNVMVIYGNKENLIEYYKNPDSIVLYVNNMKKGNPIPINLGNFENNGFLHNPFISKNITKNRLIEIK